MNLFIKCICNIFIEVYLLIYFKSSIRLVDFSNIKYKGMFDSYGNVSSIHAPKTLQICDRCIM